MPGRSTNNERSAAEQNQHVKAAAKQNGSHTALHNRSRNEDLKNKTDYLKKELGDDASLLDEDDIQMGGKPFIVEEVEAPHPPKQFKNLIQARHFKIRFSRRFASQPDAEKQYATELIRMAKEFAPKNLLKTAKVGLSLESDEFPNTIGVPFQPLRTMKVDDIVRNMENLAQSERSPLSVQNHKYLLRLTYVTPPSGSGKKRTISDILGMDAFGTPTDARNHNKKEEQNQTQIKRKKEDPVKTETQVKKLSSNKKTLLRKARKIENLMLNNVFQDCLPYALQQSTKFVEYRYGNETRGCFRETLKMNKPTNRKLASEVEIMKKMAGVTKCRDFTIEDVIKFQRGPFHGKYQIVVFADTSDRPVYAGPYISPEKQILLFLKNNHYQGVRYLGSLMKSRYVCPVCFKKSSDATTHYKCKGKHRKCGRPISECLPEENPIPISCLFCRFTFDSIRCYENHLKRGPNGGKNMCERRKCCKNCNVVYGTNKGKKHECGKKYCDICQKSMGLEHTCQMPISKRNEKGIKKLRLYFDVESAADENGRQIPVLFIAIKSCRKCGLKEIPKSLETAMSEVCDCSPEGRVKIIECVTHQNRNLNVRQEMFNYLFSKENRGYVAVAHNMRSYDGQFILQELVNKNVGEPKSMIMQGTKLTFMELNDVRLMDSMNYLQTSLQEMGKTFNVECPKGDFPVNFIKKENFDYVGEYPSLEDYNINDKTPSEAARITEFVESRRKIGSKFDFKEQLFDYCFADVVILAEAFHKFEREFESLTNVTILEESCTAASAAVKNFQRNHLRKDRPIYLDQPPSKVGFSIISQKYLAYREHLEGKEIQRKTKGGEKKIAGYKVDGYIQPCDKYPKGKVIEFNGCFHHGHDCSYRAEDVIFKGPPEIKAQDIRERDLMRLEAIKECVSEVETVWECECDQQKITNGGMAEFMNSYEVPETINIGDALSGGRTEVFRLYSKKDEQKSGRYVDVVSLYPTVMKHCCYPVGEPRFIPVEEFETPLTTRDQINFEGFMSVTILPPKQLKLPLLPTKIDNKLFFALCTACVRHRNSSTKINCKHTDEERMINGTYTTMELKKALDLGYIITKVKAVVTYPELVSIKYDENGDVTDHGLFGSYIDAMLKAKIYASGWPKGVETDEQKQEFVDRYKKKEGITLDKNKFEKNAGKRQSAKLMLNALWGKLAQRLNMVSTSIITEPETFWKLYHDSTIVIEEILLFEDGMIVKHKKRNECVNILPTSAMPLAAFTTSHARLKLYSLMEKVGPDNLLYTDTDSLIYNVTGDEDPLKNEMGEFLGQLTNELKGDMIEFVAIAPKTYAYREQLPDETVRTVRKSKGIRGSISVDQIIGFELMKQMVDEVLNNQQKTAVYVDLFNMKRDKNHQVYAKRQLKKFAYTFEKRRVLSDGSTLPFGYSCS